MIEQLSGNFRYIFEYIVLICPTYINNKTYKHFAQKDPRFIVVAAEPDSVDEINDLLKCCRLLFSGHKTLIILDDCASNKDLKKRSNEIVNLAFSARHDNFWFVYCVWILTQKLNSICKSFRENIRCLVSFNSYSKSENETLFDEFGGPIEKEEKNKIKNVLKNEIFSKIIFCLIHPFQYCIEIPCSSSKILKK